MFWVYAKGRNKPFRVELVRFCVEEFTVLYGINWKGNSVATMEWNAVDCDVFVAFTILSKIQPSIKFNSLIQLF